jgi:hypothetical protein
MAKIEAGSAEIYNSIYTTVYLYPGDKNSGYALFAGGMFDDARTTDYGAVRIYINSTQDYNLRGEPWRREIRDVGAGGNTNWEYWQWTCQSQGNYCVTIGTCPAPRSEMLSNCSKAYFDCLKLTPAGQGGIPRGVLMLLTEPEAY